MTDFDIYSIVLVAAIWLGFGVTINGNLAFYMAFPIIGIPLGVLEFSILDIKPPFVCEWQFAFAGQDLISS